MIVKILSYGIRGIEAVDVIVEVSVSLGLAKFEIIGLPDTAIKESKERIFKAIQENGYKIPPGNITINLAPAKLKKRGPIYDLPIAIGILLASKQVQAGSVSDDLLIAGELSLNGDVREVEGFFIATLQKLMQLRPYRYVFPFKNIAKIASFEEKKDHFFPVANLREAIAVLENNPSSSCWNKKGLNEALNEALNEKMSEVKRERVEASKKEVEEKLDFGDVLGNRVAKIALQLSVINRLNVLFIGPPGCGKTMLMERITSILPALSKEESFFVTRIHNTKDASVDALIEKPPFRTVHNTIHSTSLIGGGKYPEPGEITLAHKGYLFLDEFSEFNKATLQSLRVPLEKKNVRINRVEDQVTFPSDFVLLACTNPCPCGYYGDDIKMCQCSQGSMSRFYSKLSGPLLDRFDIILFINKLDNKEYQGKEGLNSSTMLENVARSIARKKEIANPFRKKNLKEIFQENEMLKDIILEANRTNFISLRKINSILKVIYTLMLYHNTPISEEVVLDAIHFCRNKVTALAG